MLVRNLLNYLENAPKYLIFTLGFSILFVINLIDCLLFPLISLSILYLIPVALVTWFGNKNLGYFFSFSSSILWCLTESLLPRQYRFLVPYWDTLVLFGFLLIVTYLLSLLKKDYKHEQKLARIDSLTGVVNRRFFMEILALERHRSCRYQHPLTLAYLDVDNFKIVNDSLGHKAGDKLLQLITKTISTQIRKTDVIARLGGDEFALLLPETNYESARVLLERVQRQLAIELESSPASVSIGAISFLELPDTIEAMLEKTDRLMYEVKKSGKSGIRHELSGECVKPPSFKRGI